MSSVESGVLPKEELVELNQDILFADSVVFGLRMNVGIDLGELQARFPTAQNVQAICSLLQRLEGEGLLSYQGTAVRLTHAGRLVCDAVGSAVLEASV